jgi:2'-5' RNA ligase
MQNARYAVAVVFDDTAGQAVRAVAERLHGLPQTVQSVAFPPHVTLAVCTDLDLNRFEVVLGECVQATHALECTLASVGIFATAEGVVFLGVAPSPQLVELQAEIFERLETIGANVEPYWIPGQWVPHCTLATSLSLDIIPHAIGRIIQQFVPITGILTRVVVVELESVDECYAFDLATQPI